MRLAWRALAWLDARLNRLYGWRGNPLYQSGTIAVAMLVVMLVTGIYLLLFYRLGAPWESVLRVQEQAWTGRWMRALHRYAADVGLVAVVVHAVRMYAQRRSWGPRALAWVSGVVLAGLFLVCGWTGYVMVWDVHGWQLAREGARLLELVPLFSEPIGRTFVGERALPSAFFFLNLFAHVALPVGMLLVLWLHVSRLARPVLVPPKKLLWSLVGLLFVLSVVVPAPLGPEADPFRIPGRAPIDLFYSFWLPLAIRAPAVVTMVVGTLVALLLLLVPLLTRPRAERKRGPSVVDQRLCTGCEQCYQDCPYEAIGMVVRPDDRPTLVARVDPALCVSCGICAGSCAPMGVGPESLTGRDQLSAVREFVAAERPGEDAIVLVGCGRAATRGGRFEGAPVLSVPCAGNLHSSVIEFLVRSGVAGVVVVTCPPRDCWSREGPKWLEQRLYFEREAELKARVDRGRVRVVHAGEFEAGVVRAELTAFRAELGGRDPAEAEPRIEMEAECDRSETGVSA